MLSRYLLQSNHFRRSDNTVRHNAFLPNTNGETSVFRINGLTEERIWQMGHDVSTQRGITLYGRADLPVTIVHDNGLDVVSAEPPVRHANIIGWPDEKEQRREIAIELASSAETFIL